MAWDPEALPDLSGRTIAVTGANAGIGYFIAEQLTGAGAEVVMLGRDAGRVEVAIAALHDRVRHARVQMVPLDLADLESVSAAATVLARLDRLDALILNAGVIRAGRDRQTTRQGFELTMGTNHLGHFALAAQALPALVATPGSTVVSIGSLTTRLAKFNPDDLQSERHYTQLRAYIQSKHAVQLFGFELDRRLTQARLDVKSVVAHPGFGIDGATPRRSVVSEPSPPARFTAKLLSPIAQSKQRSAWPIVRAAVDPTAFGGQYYGPARGMTGP